MLRSLPIIVIAALAAVPAAAEPLLVRLLDTRGQPVKDAVVTFRPAGAAAHKPAMSGRYTVSQKDLQFHPFVLVVPVGARVSFPNRDPMRHHVYSFSPAKRFELKLFAKDQSRTVLFDKAGVVALGCNIHDQMSAFIVVTDSEWTARTDAKGVARFANVPGGQARLAVWHPYLRAPGNSVARAVSGGGTEAFRLALRPPPKRMSHDY